MTLSQNPPKGTRDWEPNEFLIRSYIFDNWRKICKRYGYKEYLTPIVEYAEVYRAKSGEDIGGKELVTFLDRGGRELCIRPEMTPSLTRMVSKFYTSSQKPIRLFSIANFMRNERPQRGRNREFWQLNVDMFGADNKESDLEILEIAIELMLVFNPPKNSFKMHVNHRKIIDFMLNKAGVLDSNRIEVSRILDKWHKLTKHELESRLTESGLDREEIDILFKFMTVSSIEELLNRFPDLSESDFFVRFKQVISTMNSRGYGDFIEFKSDIVRGFDYYDGLIFEVFDNHPENNRALFGGGRYNGLSSLFGVSEFPSIGFAPGDEPMKLFLESWNLLNNIENYFNNELYYVVAVDDDVTEFLYDISKKLRNSGKNVVVNFNKQNNKKAFDYAYKNGFTHVVLIGERERISKSYKVCKLEKTD